MASVMGSSPLARGAPVNLVWFWTWLRLIPAGAGSTACEAQEGIRWAAHPRWRGEHTDVDGNALSPSGSSPLARGARQQVVVCGGDERLIPAGAGSTRSTPPAHWPTTAHPRWRGEHSWWRIWP